MRVDGATERQDDEQLDERERRPEQALHRPGGPEDVGVQRERDEDGRERLRAGEGGAGEGDELPVSEEAQRASGGLRHYHEIAVEGSKIHPFDHSSDGSLTRIRHIETHYRIRICGRPRPAVAARSRGGCGRGAEAVAVRERFLGG